MIKLFLFYWVLMMNVVTKHEPAIVLMTAFNNACEVLNVSRDDKSKILGLNKSTLSRKSNMGFSPKSKTGELQLHFIRIYRSLYAIAGGDSDFMSHWFTTENKALNGVPVLMCQTIQGLFSVNQYLDAMRGEI